VVRERIAARIIAVARLGERDPVRLLAVPVGNSNSNIPVMQPLQDWQGKRGLFCTRHPRSARPWSATGGFGPRCSILDTMREGGDDVAHQIRRHDQDMDPCSPNAAHNFMRRRYFATVENVAEYVTKINKNHR
jgi:hypothetical protein